MQAEQHLRHALAAEVFMSYSIGTGHRPELECTDFHWLDRDPQKQQTKKSGPLAVLGLQGRKGGLDHMCYLSSVDMNNQASGSASDVSTRMRSSSAETRI